MEINEYDNLKLSSASTPVKSTRPIGDSSSLFNALLSESVDMKEKSASSSSQELGSYLQKLTIPNEQSKDSSDSTDASNTHDELTLILELRRLQAS